MRKQGNLKLDPKLVFSIDIGTVSSAVSIIHGYSLEDGPLVTNVIRWPGQANTLFFEQVPSALVYSNIGELITCGGEVYTPEMAEEIAEQGHLVIEHFKMHLHPNSVLQEGQHRLQPLPEGLTLLQVYTDFLEYLVSQTRRHLRDVTGSDPWPSMEDRVEILLTHPARWGHQEQQLLEQAVVAAGIISAKGCSTRLKFAEESEAAASFCLSNEAIRPNITVGTQFIICDAGGSTADISAYQVKRTEKGTKFLKELDEPACLDAGGVRVDTSFTQHVWDRLKASDSINAEHIPDYLVDGLRDFQQFGKRLFSSASKPCYVKVGGRHDNFTNPLIQKGVYKLAGLDCERLFSPSVQLMVKAMAPYFTERKKPAFLILTGGFGESPYIQNELTQIFGAGSVVLSNPGSGGKAVAIGGLRLVTDQNDLYRIDRKERTWPTRVTDLFVRLRGFAGL